MVQRCARPQTLLWERPWPRIRPSMEFRMLAPQRTVCRPLTVPITLNRTKFHWTTELGSKQTPDHRVLLNRYPECLRRQENICPRVQGNIFDITPSVWGQRDRKPLKPVQNICVCLTGLGGAAAGPPRWDQRSRCRGRGDPETGQWHWPESRRQQRAGTGRSKAAGTTSGEERRDMTDNIWSSSHVSEKYRRGFHFDKKYLWWTSVREGVEPEVTWLLNAQQPRVLLLRTNARAPSRTWNQSLKILVNLLHFVFLL